MLIKLLLEALFMPPAINLLLLVAALLCWRRRQQLAKGLVAVSLALLWLLSTPLVAQWLIGGLENQYPVLDKNTIEQSDAQAIIVLSGGRNSNSPEYGDNDNVGLSTLVRVRYGAHLAKQINNYRSNATQAGDVPILVTGGYVLTEREPLAALMQTVLEEEYNIPVTWLETEAKTTAQNATYSAGILQENGINSVLLVTQAFHMPRSMLAFEKQGLKVTAAPTFYYSGADISPIFLLIPTSVSLDITRLALHEWIGLVVYRF